MVNDLEQLTTNQQWNHCFLFRHAATPAVGKSTYELNVAETLIYLSKDAVTHPTINTESENTATEMMEEDQLQGIKEASTATCDS